MDGSEIRGLSLNDRRNGPVKSTCRNIGRIFVEGYDTNLPQDDVERALRKLFSSCGEITDISIRDTSEDDTSEDGLCSAAIIYLIGEDEFVVDKAMQLSGSEVEGWKAIVTPYPFARSAGRLIMVYVTGYDTSLSEIDLESALREHFSSCGKIGTITISKKHSYAEVLISGEDAQDKAMELNGSYLGGRQLLVKLTSGAIFTVHPKFYRLPKRV
ncbi:unnamed protein product [Eruca vesicaria subsp. sativa]|uniref:RRM domain-containing protein n=1 Tax=Eruca vesicaria subsp. sativa TaxID=29727 RepID=A0ABC8K131_ERUVS|nr:unnamed protein product [Eruca vesicaria subsp. sativa]